MFDVETARICVQLAYVLFVMRDDELFSFHVQNIHSRLENRLKAYQDPKFVIMTLARKSSLRQGNTEEAVKIFRDIFEKTS